MTRRGRAIQSTGEIDKTPHERKGTRIPFGPPASIRELFRETASFSTYTGLVPPPGVFRPFGISAMIIARNEAEWIETSVKSLLGHVDEIVTADHGSEDGTGDIMRDLVGAYPEEVRYVPLSGETLFHEALNYLIDQSKYRWVLRFSGDFIARTSGIHSIDRLLEFVRTLDRRRYFCIRLSGVALQGDLEHQFPRRRDRAEQILYTYSPWLRYCAEKQWESLHVPAFYQKLAPDPAFYFHMETVKPNVRVMQKYYWHQWFEARLKGSTAPLREFATERAMSDWGGTTLEEAAKNFVVQEFQGCIPFSRELCGEYPEILKPALDAPPFKLIFEKGRVTDRIQGGRYRPKSKGVGGENG